MPAEDIRHPEKQPMSSKGDYEPYSNSPSGEAAQMPAPATSKRRLGREVWAALLRVRIGPECP